MAIEGVAIALRTRVAFRYKVQLGRPFEHDARLKDLLAKQAQLNAPLDLDQHEAQVVAEDREPEERIVPASFAARIQAESHEPAMAL